MQKFNPLEVRRIRVIKVLSRRQVEECAAAYIVTKSPNIIGAVIQTTLSDSLPAIISLLCPPHTLRSLDRFKALTQPSPAYQRMDTPACKDRAGWRSGNSLTSHSRGPGLKSRAGHPDFGFSMVSRNHSKPNAEMATCSVSNDLAVNETLSPITYRLFTPAGGSLRPAAAPVEEGAIVLRRCDPHPDLQPRATSVSCRVKAVHDKVSTSEINLRKNTLLLHAYILTAYNKVRCLKLVAGFTSLGRYSLSAGVDRSLVRDLGHPDSSQLVCGGKAKPTPYPLHTHQTYLIAALTKNITIAAPSQTASVADISSYNCETASIASRSPTYRNPSHYCGASCIVLRPRLSTLHHPPPPHLPSSGLYKYNCRRGGGGVVVRLLTSCRDEPGSIPGGVTPGISHVGIVPDNAAGRRVFTGYFPFPVPFHSGVAPYSPRFTLIGSHDLDVRSRPNLFTYFTHTLGFLTEHNCLRCEIYQEKRDTTMTVELLIISRRQLIFGEQSCTQSYTSVDSGKKHWGRVIEVSMEWQRNERAGKEEIPEKTLRPTASSGTIPTCENPVTRPGTEPGSPWWEKSYRAEGFMNRAAGPAIVYSRCGECRSVEYVQPARTPPLGPHWTSDLSLVPSTLQIGLHSRPLFQDSRAQENLGFIRAKKTTPQNRYTRWKQTPQSDDRGVRPPSGNSVSPELDENRSSCPRRSFPRPADNCDSCPLAKFQTRQ
ncbi:hypothetical protein PR048_017487 [Dryococelus australis]|uniref:Uncharacterized protein n=1 Tax=Dryococelus australis TaxID=614101 RepID=A0ABQ9H9P6_9NEOP|nr:hypothetical protein PR048_017487 [Dryococelus australis]